MVPHVRFKSLAQRTMGMQGPMGTVTFLCSAFIRLKKLVFLVQKNYGLKFHDKHDTVKMMIPLTSPV